MKTLNRGCGKATINEWKQETDIKAKKVKISLKNEDCLDLQNVSKLVYMIESNTYSIQFEDKKNIVIIAR